MSFFLHNLLFIHIPKTAGSSISKALYGSTDPSKYLLDVQKKIPNCKPFIPSQPHRSLRHMRLEDYEKFIPKDILNKLCIFSVVRNPFSRFLSQFFYVRKNNFYFYSGKLTTDWSKNALLKDFKQYLNRLNKLSTEQRMVAEDGHFELQTDMIKGISQVEIFKYEEIEKLENWLKLKTNNQNFTFPCLNKTITEKFELIDFYPKDLQEIILKIYEKDFNNFNYSKNLE